MTDIATRLRQTRADMIGTDDEQHYWDCHDAADEIERLRQFDRPQPIKTADATSAKHTTHDEGSVQNMCTLTDEEREAIELFASLNWTSIRWSAVEKHAATLRNLLERLSHDAAPEAIANAESVAPQPTAGDRSGNPTSHSGTGNTQEPVAWARFFPNGGIQSVYLDRPPADSEPLYRPPLCQDSLQKNLTEAEHDALEFVVETGRVAMHDESTLRKLLERLT